jgi:hypothetical protein
MQRSRIATCKASSTLDSAYMPREASAYKVPEWLQAKLVVCTMQPWSWTWTRLLPSKCYDDQGDRKYNY